MCPPPVAITTVVWYFITNEYSLKNVKKDRLPRRPAVSHPSLRSSAHNSNLKATLSYRIRKIDDELSSYIFKF